MKRLPESSPLRLTRRDFIGFAAALSAFGLTGCVSKDPVTGKKTLVGLSRGQEIGIDREQSPHQFSSDFGELQDTSLNNYITEVGNSMSSRSHRADMPYSFRGVNANYVNAYAFPGGSIAVTRGILLEIENEAELAALLGHEVGHVNARHAAERMSRSMIGNVLVAGASIVAANYGGSAAGSAVQQLGSVGSGALLAHYSRDDEREADELGMDYMVRSDRNPQGMVGLMEILLEEQKHKPNALETMFSTHPLSSERVATARQRADIYVSHKNKDLGRERYMDETARLRPLKAAVDDMQKGEELLNAEKFKQAEPVLRTALKKAPKDYVANTLMARCQIGLDKPAEAERYADIAKAIYPREAQAREIAGLSKIMQKQYGSAYADFTAYDQLLPGNPSVGFLRGLSLDGMGRKQEAASLYRSYLQQTQQGGMAKHAVTRLRSWGYIR